jgi:3'-phosphoadenosine 5'-phosphosulfate sulfotransferase (PAPS reductase)/FAD synthetase
MNLAELEKYDGTPLIVKLSYGKDSYATVLALLDAGIRPLAAVYCDTGWESLSHYEYVERERPRLMEKYGINVVTVRAHFDLPPELEALAKEIEEIGGLPSPSAMVRRILAYKVFSRPSRGSGGKWCTDELKARPFAAWLRSQDLDVDPVIATGVRADESIVRSSYQPWERQERSPRLMEWRPLLHWKVEDVGQLLTRHGIPRHPLYLDGTDRVGCWLCVHCGKKDLNVMKGDKRRIACIRRLEEVVGMLRGESTAFLLAKTPKDGAFLPVPIDEAIAWSQTAHGGRQFLLFDKPVVDPCERWGWCDV